MRAAIIAAMLLAVTLAGCAEGTEPIQNDDPAFEDFEDVQVSDDTGIIRGVVVDAAIVPLVDVTIEIRSLGIETTTNENGAFLFTDLEPGSYFLHASGQGLVPVQTSTTVEAGIEKPPIVRIQMALDPEAQPIIIQHVFDGFIACSVTGPVVAFAACSAVGLVHDMGDRFITFIDVPGNPHYVVAEQIWKSTQPAGDALSFGIYDGDTTAPSGGRVMGPSPLVMKHDQDYWNQTSPSPMVAPGEQISYRTFSAGHPATTAGGTWGVGVTVEQKYSVYVHIFYNEQPPEEWLFHVDGTYAPDQ